MSSDMYSTNPSLIAAISLGAPPFIAEMENFNNDALNMGLIGIAIASFSLIVAITISWGVGHRSIVLQCPIIGSIGAVIGCIGWIRADNITLAIANACIIITLIAITLYTAKTTRLH